MSFDQLEEMERHVWLEDIFECNIITYLQKLKPKATLGTAFCSKLLEGLWRSNYYTSNGSFFNYSTSYQILQNQVISKHAGTPSLGFVCSREASYPLHEYTMPVWQQS